MSKSPPSFVRSAKIGMFCTIQAVSPPASAATFKYNVWLGSPTTSTVNMPQLEFGNVAVVAPASYQLSWLNWKLSASGSSVTGGRKSSSTTETLIGKSLAAVSVSLSRYTWTAVNSVTPAASVTVLLSPSPQFTVTTCVSAVPGSTNVPLSVTLWPSKIVGSFNCTSTSDGRTFSTNTSKNDSTHQSGSVMSSSRT